MKSISIAAERPIRGHAVLVIGGDARYCGERTCRGECGMPKLVVRNAWTSGTTVQCVAPYDGPCCWFGHRDDWTGQVVEAGAELVPHLMKRRWP